MKNIFLLTTIFLLSCDFRDRDNKDIKLNPDTRDTLEVIKRYPSGKIKEIIYFKNNRPDSNTCYLEKGDTVDIPKLIYIKSDTSVFLFIPIRKQYKDIALFFVNTDSVKELYLKTGFGDTNTTLTIHPLKKSTDFPLDNRMVRNKKINGVIKSQNRTGPLTFDFWPFSETTQ